MDNRPHSRLNTAATGSASVHRRGSGLGTGPVGKGPSGFGSSGPGIPIGGTPVTHKKGVTRGRSIGGGTLILVIIIVIFMMSMGGFGGSSYSDDVNDLSGEQGYDQNGVTGFGTGSSGSPSSGSLFDQSVPASPTDMADVDRSVSSAARDKYTVIKGNGEDSVTLMVYICGSNLESENGMATSDLNEMASAALENDKVHVVVETGGAKKWRNSVVKSDSLGRYEVVKGGIKPLENLRSAAMTDPGVLTDFIKFSAERFPANRYMLVLWDHGGGSASGFGYDERYPNGTMRLDGVAKALKDSGIKFDFVGFDACLMAGMETAFALEPYADYLVASEETEPGTGWYYTNWLSALSVDPSTPTTDIGKHIIDDFVERSSPDRNKITLSLTDLAEFSGLVPEKLTAFGNEISSDIKEDNYQSVADARAGSKEFHKKIDQVDLVDFCNRLGSGEAKELSEAVKKSVKYNRTANVPRAYGMSFYFPFRATGSMKDMNEIYENIDMDEAFTSSVKSFATLEASGQIASTSTQGGQGSLIGSLMMGGLSSAMGSSDIDYGSLLMQALASGAGARSIPSDAVDVSYEPGYPGGGRDYASILGDDSWVSESDVQMASSYVEKHSLNGVDLSFIDKHGERALSLPEDVWKNVETMELSVFCEDGAGYVDLGLDNLFEFDDDGDLIVAFDGAWLALDSHICCYYMTSDQYEEDGSYVTEGYVPAFIDGVRADIILRFTDKEPGGVVLGYKHVNENGLQDKGLTEIVQGSEIELICDYYDRSGKFDDSYYLGEPFEASEKLTVSKMNIENPKYKFGYRLTDLYGNHYWTELVEVENPAAAE